MVSKRKDLHHSSFEGANELKLAMLFVSTLSLEIETHTHDCYAYYQY